MRTRLEIYRSIEAITKGDIHHLRQHLPEIRAGLRTLFKELGFTPALFSGLHWCVDYGTHAELVLKCQSIHQLIRGK